MDAHRLSFMVCVALDIPSIHLLQKGRLSSAKTVCFPAIRIPLHTWRTRRGAGNILCLVI